MERDRQVMQIEVSKSLLVNSERGSVMRVMG